MDALFVQRVRKAVSTYLNIPVALPRITILPDTEFDRNYNTLDDRLFGGVGALVLPSREIVLPRRFQTDLVHELVHVAFKHENGVSEPINEGVTQVAAEEIARILQVPIRKTYPDSVRYVRTRLIPATGKSVQPFLRGYARAADKGEYVARLIWIRHKRRFADPVEWGSSDRVQIGLREEIRRGMGRFDPYTEYLAEEGVL